MRGFVAGVAGLLLGVPSVALGACPTPYTTDNLLVDLTVIEQGLRDGDNATAGDAAKRMRDGIACLDEVLPTMIVGRTYRAIGAGLYVGGDQMGAMDWFATAVDIEQTFEYGLEDLPIDHPIRDAYAGAKGTPGGNVPVSGMIFIEDGEHYIDGRKTKEPKARLNRPHLYQWALDDQVQSWIVSGNEFPPDTLTPGSLGDAVADAGNDGGKKGKKGKKDKPPKPPKEKKDKPTKVAKDKGPKGKDISPTTNSEGVVTIARQRPWEKTPLMIGGGAIIAGAGAVYYLSSVSRGKFDDAGTLAETEQFQRQTNQLVIASAAVLAAGSGVLTWGIILDGGPPSPGFQIRF